MRVEGKNKENNKTSKWNDGWESQTMHIHQPKKNIYVLNIIV
jgi:hypothetical protein